MCVPPMLSSVTFQYATPSLPESPLSNFGLAGTPSSSFSFPLQNSPKSAGAFAAGAMPPGSATAPPTARPSGPGFHVTTASIVPGASNLDSSTSTPALSLTSPRPTSFRPPLFSTYCACGGVPPPSHCTVQCTTSPTL